MLFLESTGTCSKGDACSFRRNKNKRGNKTQSSSLSPRHQMTEEDLRKEVHPESVVLQEGSIKQRAETTLKEAVRIRRVIIGFLPYVKNHI